jgi:predicted ATP-grasp superfamily ATP-dependent carboligase
MRNEVLLERIVAAAQKSMRSHCALVLGGYINGYSIIKELNEKKVKNVVLFDYYRNSLGSKSNRISSYKKIDKTIAALKTALFELKEKFHYIIIFPTDDLQLENLHAIYNEINTFCFLPFNYNSLLDSLKKAVQCRYCELNNIPYPKTRSIETISDIRKIKEIPYPIIIKPNKRDDIRTDVFRSLLLNSDKDFDQNATRLTKHIQNGLSFLASEVIPGDDTNIYAYVGYRSHKGKILNEWSGRKLTQFPDNYGVFSSASNEAPEVINEQGRKLLEAMDLMGICEPEFKFDFRDNKYKLMEINLRSMMWHRVGNLSGVNIQYTQYLDAIGYEVPKQIQDKQNITHFVYMTHEIINLFSRRGYWKHFKHNVFGAPKREFAVFDKNDIKPFLFNVFPSFRGLVGRWLRILKLR